MQILTPKAGISAVCGMKQCCPCKTVSYVKIGYVICMFYHAIKKLQICLVRSLLWRLKPLCSLKDSLGFLF